MRRSWLLALHARPLVDLVKFDLVDLLALDQLGLAGVVDLDLLQHLADNHLDMLVVDRHALQPIDLLDLVDQVGGEILHAPDRKDVVRRRIALDDVITLLDDVAVLEMDVLALGNQVLACLFVLVGRLDGDATLVLVIASEPHGTRDLGDDCGLLRPARLEQFGDARQTAGDIAGLRALGRDARDDVARLDLRTGLNREHGVNGEHVARLAAAAELEHLAVIALDHDRRSQVGGTARRAPVGHHALGDTGGFIERFRHRLAFDQVLEPDRALDLGHDRPGIGIPLRDTLAAFDLIAVLDLDPRTVLDAVQRPLGAVLIDHDDDHVARHGDQLAVRVALYGLVSDPDRAIEI